MGEGAAGSTHGPNKQSAFDMSTNSSKRSQLSHRKTAVSNFMTEGAGGYDLAL
jgi:hypothetical protein